MWRRGRRTRRRSATIDKGQKAELAAFVDAVKGNQPMPIAYESLIATTKAALQVSASVRGNQEGGPRSSIAT